LKRRFTGSNNGRIILSHRDAAKALNVHRNTVGPWFTALQDRGFIRMTQAPHLGPTGIGKASVWALDELPTDDMKQARKQFAGWRQNQNPRTKKQDAPSQ
jgi:DNA-binding transcriptional MocR family regulator